MAREWSAEVKDLGDKIVGLSLLKAKELADYLKEQHGIEAAAPAAVAVAAAPGAPGAPGAAPAAVEEKTAFDVILAKIGDKKLQVIKVVRDHRSGPEGSQGTGRRRPEAREAGPAQGRGERHRAQARGTGRGRRDQVTVLPIRGGAGRLDRAATPRHGRRADPLVHGCCR